MEFIRIYVNAMRDLGARDYYFFSESYFEQLVAVNDFKPFIIFASFEGKVIAASMFVVTNKIMQYYLSGSCREFRGLSASKSIIATAHELAESMNLDHLVLGGGLGGARDSLFKFKAGFSGAIKPFYVTKMVFSERIYCELCESKQHLRADNCFFPLYRQ